MAHDCSGHSLPAFNLSECYSGLKLKAVHGDELTETEREFVGVGDGRDRGFDRRDGWRQPSDSAWELDSVLPREDLEILQALMSVGTSADVEFLAQVGVLERAAVQSWPSWQAPSAWQADAACRGLPLEVFFPDGTGASKFEQARAICAG